MSIYYRLTIAAVLAALLAAGFWTTYKKGDRAGAARIQQAWDGETARRAIRTAEAQITARTTEQALAQNAVVLERKKHASTSAIAGARSAELDRMRDRPSTRADDRPSKAASPAPDSVGCTGAGLARPDAEFLTRYAADAARLRVELDRCTALYDKAVDLSSTLE